MVTALALRVQNESWLNDWLVLTKFRISSVSTLTAAMGYIAVSRALGAGLLSAVLGTLCMAMAASAFNEIEERDVDALMPRTRTRPIPGGRISVQMAALAAVALACSGLSLLYFVHGATPAWIGLLALLWYNGIYTPLKRVTAFAVVPGSVIGALPPAIGWTAAGGELHDPALLSLGFVFFVWQVPHFWLLAMRHQADYAAGRLPTLSKHFSDQQIFRLVFTWTSASIAATGLLWVFRAISGTLPMVGIVLAAAWLMVRYAFMLEPHPDVGRAMRAFMDINYFALIVMAAVVVDALTIGW